MSSTPDPSKRDDSLVEGSHPLSSYPAFRGKQVVLGAVAVVFLVTMFLPWWDAELILDRAADTLNGWLLLVTGLSIGSLGVLTDYSWFGNVLFGLVPVLPPLVVTVLAILRVLRGYVAPANTIAVWAIVCVVGELWIIFYGTLRIDASNGVYPVLAGPWIVLVVSLVLAALCLLWWRAERAHFAPSWLARRAQERLGGITEPGADDGGAPGEGDANADATAVGGAHEPVDATDELFSELESIDADDDQGDDSPIATTGIIDLSDVARLAEKRRRPERADDES
ncbi:MAG: hypothetical protein ACTH31_09200 [Pseudoclavibacter sp.]